MHLAIFGVLIKHEPTAKQFIHIIVENSIHSQSSVQVENLQSSVQVENLRTFLYKSNKADCFEDGRLISVRQKDSRLFLFANEILGE